MKWPDQSAIRQWQKRIRLRLQKIGKNQQWLAQRAMVSIRLVESWLADPEKSWHRQPSYPESIGINEIISRNQDLSQIADKREARMQLLDRRKKAWAGKTPKEVAALENISVIAVSEYARKNRIELTLSKRGRKRL